MTLNVVNIGNIMKRIIGISISEELLQSIDVERGDVARSKFLCKIMVNALENKK